MNSDSVLLRIASLVYTKKGSRGYRWEDIRDAILEQSADQLPRLGERELQDHVGSMMEAWERQKFERAAVETGDHPALVAGAL